MLDKNNSQKVIPFRSTYLCESGFSTLLPVKAKNRNRLCRRS